MKKGLGLFSFASVFCIAGYAMAQEAPPPATTTAAPPPRVGFQMALRTGYAVPMGYARGANPGSNAADLKMSDGFSGQVPLFIEIGGKIVPNLFLGGYLGFGFGGAAGEFDAICSGSGVSCVAVGVRFGAEVQYHILPGETANPWVGYGIGFESLALSMSAGGQTATDSFGGFEYAHLMAGVDFRLNRIFGIGPFVDFSIGEYTRYHVEAPGLATIDGDIQTTRTHEWLAFGVRGTFFP
jgi:hypothetical protein